jgi:hypothetical protein
MCSKPLHVALYLNPHILPHLPSVLTDRQVVECCRGTGTLVPRSRHEHVVNMGRRGHARVSDLVTQTSQGPLSPISMLVLLQPTCLLSLTLVRAAKRVSYHVLSNRDVVRDGRPSREQRPLLHARQPRVEPSYHTMVITV